MKDISKKNINFESISEEEKALLKKRLAKSVFGDVRRKKFTKYGMGILAVILLIFLPITMFNTNRPSSSAIENFAKSIKENNPTDKIQLVLSADHQIEIGENNASITYSNNGKQVQIGAAQSVSQKTADHAKTVFNTLIVPFGKRSQIVLSDGSKVWLNSGSKLVFPAYFSADKREVYLEGEAIFEVAHDKKHPFLVKSEHHEIEVLGTVFNVSNYSDDPAIYTVLESGSIQINITENQFLKAQNHIRIVPGTLASFDKNGRGVTTETVDTAPYFAWREGIFIFKNTPFQSIMKKISRYYNVEIIINNEKLANETFSGHLDLKENVEHLMQIIKETETSEFEFHWSKDDQLIINSAKKN